MGVSKKFDLGARASFLLSCAPVVLGRALGCQSRAGVKIDFRRQPRDISFSAVFFHGPGGNRGEDPRDLAAPRDFLRR